MVVLTLPGIKTVWFVYALALNICVFLVTECFFVILLSLCHEEGNKNLSISLQMAFARSFSDLGLAETCLSSVMPGFS